MLLNFLLSGKDLCDWKSLCSGYFLISKLDLMLVVDCIIFKEKIKVLSKASVCKLRYMCEIHIHSFDAYQVLKGFVLSYFLKLSFYYLSLRPVVLGRGTQSKSSSRQKVISTKNVPD